MKHIGSAVLFPIFLVVLCAAQPCHAQDSLVLPLRTKLVNTAVQLNWKINFVGDSVDFIIERSKDARRFEVLSRQRFLRPDSDNGYIFTDNFPYTDSGFYRVKWLGQEMEPVFTEVSKIDNPVQPKIELNVMPNPVFNNATLIINHEELGEIACILYDMSGKSIRSYNFKKTTPYMQHILDMYTVPKGSYILNVRGATFNESKRILKQ